MNNVQVKGFTKESIHKLETHVWRGNVRELENAIERAVVLTGSDYIQTEDLPTEDHYSSIGETPKNEKIVKGLNLEEEKPITLDELSKRYIQHIFDKNGGAKEQTAKDLGIDRKTLYRKLKEMNLN